MINNCEEIKLEVINTNRYRDGGSVGIDIRMVDGNTPDNFIIGSVYAILFIDEPIEFRLSSPFRSKEEEGIYINYRSRQQPGRFKNITILRLLLQAVILMSDKEKDIKDRFLNEIKKELREHGINELTE